jgi:hypothetical protein
MQATSLLSRLRRGPIVPQATHEWHFRKSLLAVESGNVAGPYDLAAIAAGGVLTGDRYTFGPQQGLRGTNVLGANLGDYTIAMVVSLDDRSTQVGFSGYSRILDFSDLALDFGLYIRTERVLTGVTPTVELLGSYDAMTPNVPHSIVVTRDAVSTLVHVYCDGKLQFSFVDATDVFKFATNHVNFFHDNLDTPEDVTSGSVLYIGLWQRGLTPAEVANL